jgi:hypothetical protein
MKRIALLETSHYHVPINRQRQTAGITGPDAVHDFRMSGEDHL